MAGARKLSGILLEAETVGGHLAVAVGMGTNVVSAPEGTPYPATSLSALGITANAEDLFMRAVGLMGRISRPSGTTAKAFPDIRRLWLERAAGLGEAVSVQSGGGTIEGVFETIDDTGCLIIAGRDGKVHADCRRRRAFRIGQIVWSSLMSRPDELTFAPLGGVGEIGMNLSIYGLGNRHQRSWLAIDLGVSFGNEEHLPGIDVIMPDIRFLVKERKNSDGSGSDPCA